MSGKFDIDRIAALSRLRLTDSEKERLGQHLETIIEYIDLLNQLETSHVEPTSHVIPIQNVFREDVPRKSLPEKDFLSQAPAGKKGHYQVPRII
ncbi:MAG: Asp-tRNA(Asn)/Glu-tRNA(Gln) amidotransferase subunit GatC [Nitrospinaceae bacterium]